MTLQELQYKLKDAGAKPDAGRFMLLNSRQLCEWIDVWMGVFRCDAVSKNGAFYVHDSANEAVVELE